MFTTHMAHRLICIITKILSLVCNVHLVNAFQGRIQEDFGERAAHITVQCYNVNINILECVTAVLESINVWECGLNVIDLCINMWMLY